MHHALIIFEVFNRIFLYFIFFSLQEKEDRGEGNLVLIYY